MLIKPPLQIESYNRCCEVSINTLEVDQLLDNQVGKADQSSDVHEITTTDNAAKIASTTFTDIAALYFPVIGSAKILVDEILKI
ncbi:7868_t:CDS:2, partial [Racocetra persica]